MIHGDYYNRGGGGGYGGGYGGGGYDRSYPPPPHQGGPPPPHQSRGPPPPPHHYPPPAPHHHHHQNHQHHHHHHQPPPHHHQPPPHHHPPPPSHHHPPPRGYGAPPHYDRRPYDDYDRGGPPPPRPYDDYPPRGGPGYGPPDRPQSGPSNYFEPPPRFNDRRPAFDERAPYPPPSAAGHYPPSGRGPPPPPPHYGRGDYPPPPPHDGYGRSRDYPPPGYGPEGDYGRPSLHRGGSSEIPRGGSPPPLHRGGSSEIPRGGPPPPLHRGGSSEIPRGGPPPPLHRGGSSEIPRGGPPPPPTTLHRGGSSGFPREGQQRDYGRPNEGYPRHDGYRGAGLPPPLQVRQSGEVRRPSSSSAAGGGSPQPTERRTSESRPRDLPPGPPRGDIRPSTTMAADVRVVPEMVADVRAGGGSPAPEKRPSGEISLPEGRLDPPAESAADRSTSQEKQPLVGLPPVVGGDIVPAHLKKADTAPPQAAAGNGPHLHFAVEESGTDTLREPDLGEGFYDDDDTIATQDVLDGGFDFLNMNATERLTLQLDFSQLDTVGEDEEFEPENVPQQKVNPLDPRFWFFLPPPNKRSILKGTIYSRKTKNTNRVTYAQCDVTHVGEADYMYGVADQQVWWTPEELEQRRMQDEMDQRLNQMMRVYSEACARAFAKLADRVLRTLDRRRNPTPDIDALWNDLKLAKLLKPDIMTGMAWGFRGVELGGVAGRETRSAEHFEMVIDHRESKSYKLGRQARRARRGDNLCQASEEFTLTHRLWARTLAMADQVNAFTAAQQ